jgi:hypothetical protein
VCVCACVCVCVCVCACVCVCVCVCVYVCVCVWVAMCEVRTLLSFCDRIERGTMVQQSREETKVRKRWGQQLKEKSIRQASNKQGRGESAVMCAVCCCETQRILFHFQYVHIA